VRLVFIGPPGAGKGTQVLKLSREYGVEVFSTGEAFRKHIYEGSEMGKKAEEYVKKGLLVPDDIVLDIVKQFVDNKDNFIMDGFPRNVYQAEIFDDFLNERGLALDGVVYIFLDEDQVVNRLKYRIVCPKCGAVYNMKTSPPRKDMICDVCGTKLKKRVDDSDEVIRNRYKVYVKEISPLVDYYDRKGILFKVDGIDKQEDVYKKIKELLKIG